MTSDNDKPAIILIPGHWLGAWAWGEVVAQLAAAGRRALPLTLPGLAADDPDRTSRTLDDQAAAIEQAIESAGGTAAQPVVLVAHSGANLPVTLVLDRHPELVARVIWVDSGPVASGTVFAPDLPEEVDELPLPAFESLGQQASLVGLSATALEHFRDRAVPQPGAVLRQSVNLTNTARLQVPTTLVCCSMPGAAVMEFAKAGHPMFAEVGRLEDVELIDLPTGHWPMWSCPVELAHLIGTVSA